jgi:pteridine reductase
MLTRSLAKEVGPEVRVNAVAPGVALWPDEGLTEEEKEAMLQRSVMGRPSGAEPVAEAVHYLAAADYITGQVLGVEGGRLLY